ncbi:hypothetical protein ACHAQA_000974 [Verticillium albo-atrum]
MGDLSSSLFALGYHERIDENISNIPLFIAELRKAVSARIFAADKSLAIFLGRPPRIVKSYYSLQLPANIPSLWEESTGTAGDGNGQPDLELTCRSSGGGNAEDPSAINYTADTRCSASFASVKEDILDLHRSRLRGGHAEKASAIELDIEKLWEQLPNNFKLETNLKDSRLGPFQRDFLVAMYGLPAAGVISLALLNPAVSLGIEPTSRSKMVQNLSVLVAELQIGVLIQAGDPNFALFTRATQTMQSLLDSLLVSRFPIAAQNQPPNVGIALPEQWDPNNTLDPWEFEHGFWAYLAEHPTLLQQEAVYP